jgi:hypothetical protein
MQKESEVTIIYKWTNGKTEEQMGRDVRKDLQTMKFKNWKKSVLDRDS